jgi:hypothetical protein
LDKDKAGARGNAAGDASPGDGGAMPGRDPRFVRDIALQQGLRAAYRTVIEEPLPDRFLSLLQQLDEGGPTR